MNRIIAYLLLIAIICYSCSKDNGEELRAIVEKEIVVFGDTALPSELGNVLSNNDIVVFGETHYVQEHQQFIVEILSELSQRGYKVIFQELFHSFNWILEDYINGDITELPEFLLYFDEVLIEGIKSFNLSVEEDARIILKYMDVNQWNDNFLRSVEEMQKIIGSTPIITQILNLDKRNSNYEASLRGINNLIVINHEEFIVELGEKWYVRLKEIIEGEIKSLEYKNSEDEGLREVFMKDIILSYLEDNPGDKALVNTGMFHAQKEIFMGSDISRLRQLLDDESYSTESIAFIGIRGSTKIAFNDSTNKTYDLSLDSSDSDLVRIIDENAGGNMSFLSLSSGFFKNKLTVSYSNRNTIKAPIGLQFDAIITYPEISILHSMDVYDWRK